MYMFFSMANPVSQSEPFLVRIQESNATEEAGEGLLHSDCWCMVSALIRGTPCACTTSASSMLPQTKPMT